MAEQGISPIVPCVCVPLNLKGQRRRPPRPPTALTRTRGAAARRFGEHCSLLFSLAARPCPPKGLVSPPGMAGPGLCGWDGRPHPPQPQYGKEQESRGPWKTTSPQEASAAMSCT